MPFFKPSDPFDDFNPYAPPAKTTADELESEAAEREPALAPSVGGFAGRVDGHLMFAWEKQRLLYNAALVVWTLMLSLLFGGLEGMVRLEWLGLTAAGAIFANFCYCAGPVAEFYLTILGAPIKPVRLLIFFGGTLCAMGFSALALLVFFSPPF